LEGGAERIPRQHGLLVKLKHDVGARAAPAEFAFGVLQAAKNPAAGLS